MTYGLDKALLVKAGMKDRARDYLLFLRNLRLESKSGLKGKGVSILNGLGGGDGGGAGKGDYRVCQ